MPAGRCAGCGYSDTLRRTQLHVLTCPDYLARYAAEPASAPDPATAMAAHQAANTAEQRAMARDGRLRERFVDLDRRQTRQRERWSTPADILDD
jgi:hypothetical protein